MTVGRQVARGSALSYGAFLAGKVLAYVSTVALARLLVPDDFGVISYAFLVLGFMFVVRGLGTTTSLVSHESLTDDDAGEIFVLTVVVSFAWTVIAWVTAPAAAAFFHEPRVTAVTRALAVSFVLRGLGEIHSAQMQRRMHFGRRVLPGLFFNVIRGSVSIGLAVAGAGYWSLVWGQLAGDAVSTLSCWVLFRWRPRLVLRWTSARRLVRYGLQVATLDIVALLLVSVDNLIVGRTLGTTALGIYALAFVIPQMLTMGLAGAVSQTVFPAFVAIQRDIEVLRHAYLQVLRSTAFVLVPIGLGLSAVTPAFVHTFFTPVWWPMIPVTEALAVYATLYALGASAGDVYLALGRPDLQWKLDGVQLMVLVPMLIVGARLDGIAGVAVAQLVAVVPYAVARTWLLGRTLGLPYGSLAEAVRIPLVAGCGLYMVTRVVERLPGAHANPSVVLLLQVGLGAASYLGLALLQGGLSGRRFGMFPVPRASTELTRGD